MDQKPIALKPKQTKLTPNIQNKLSTFFYYEDHDSEESESAVL